MPLPIISRWCFAVAALGLCMHGGTAQTTDETAIWQKVASYLTKEAQIELRGLSAPQDASSRREREFCTAVVTLDQQPLSESRLDDVEAQLKGLLAAELDDEIDRASRYLLGRMAQLYRAEPDIALAATYYRDLIERGGPGHFADLARVKLSVLVLYALPAENADERVAQAETLLPGTSDQFARRDLHRIVARGMLFYNQSPEVALRHLLAADEIGGLVGALGADQLVQIGELAWDTGDEALANQAYERLRVEYPRDPRIFLMDQRNAGNPVPTRGEAIHGR